MFAAYARTVANSPGIIAGGLLSTADLQLTAPGSGMSVNVSTGEAIIGGSEGGAQGGYYARATSTTNLSIAAANATNPRIDTVCATISDAGYTEPTGGSGNQWAPQVVTGTATVGATLANLTGAAALPLSSLLLGYVLVPALSTNVITGNIANVANVVPMQNAAGPLVTALPTSPTDGQTASFLADGTNGVIWHFRYRAGSASAFKWEFIGGSPLWAQTTANAATTTSAAFQDLTGGPSLTLPTLPTGGDFDIAWGAAAQGSGSAIDTYLGVSIGGVDPARAATDPLCAVFAEGTGATLTMIDKHNRTTGLTSASVVKLRYSPGSGGTASYADRWLAITPVRIG